MSDVLSNPLLALLKDQGMLDDLQLEEVNEEFNQTGRPIIELLDNKGFMDRPTVLQLIADNLGTEVVEINALGMSESAVSL